MSADDAVVQRLRNLGWTEGQNILVERRFASGSVDQLKVSAAELVRLKVDVIVAAASMATQAAKDATPSIPIVFVNTGDPLGQGFVQSLAHPGGKHHWGSVRCNPGHNRQTSATTHRHCCQSLPFGCPLESDQRCDAFLLERYEKCGVCTARRSPIPGGTRPR